MRDRIIDAAREVAKQHAFDAEITEIARRGNMSTSSLYRYFASREAVLRELLLEVQRDVAASMGRIAGIDDANDALAAWMHVGYATVDDYGKLAMMVAADLMPEWARPIVAVEALYGFTGHLVRRWRDAGGCDPDIDINAAVRLWFALSSPVRVIGYLNDGLSTKEIADATLDLFRSSFRR